MFEVRKLSIVMKPVFAADLTSANFQLATLKCLKFINRNISNNQFFQGVNFDGSSLYQVRFKNIDFSKKHNNDSFPLNSVYSRMIETHGAKTSFSHATLKQVVFDNCNLENLSFCSSSIRESVFDNCNLTNADFHCCYNTLSSIFNDSNLENADFRIF